MIRALASTDYDNFYFKTEINEVKILDGTKYPVVKIKKSMQDPQISCMASISFHAINLLHNSKLIILLNHSVIIHQFSGVIVQILKEESPVDSFRSRGGPIGETGCYVLPPLEHNSPVREWEAIFSEIFAIYSTSVKVFSHRRKNQHPVGNSSSHLCIEM